MEYNLVLITAATPEMNLLHSGFILGNRMEFIDPNSLLHLTRRPRSSTWEQIHRSADNGSTAVVDPTQVSFLPGF